MAPSRQPRRLAAAATALAGVMTIVSALSPNAPARERVLIAFEPEAAQAVAHRVALAGGLLALWLALGVLQGRRTAGRAAIVVLGMLALVHLAKGLDYEEALLGLGVAAGLAATMRAGRRDERAPAALIAALVALVAAVASFAVALGTSGVAADAGVHTLVAVAAGALTLALSMLLAPKRVTDGHDAASHRRAAAIIAVHGHDSIAPFALRADKAFHFAGGGMLAYRTLRETAVVAGDPVGPPGCAGPVMASFLGHARSHGWDVVLLGAVTERLPVYEALGLRTLQVGLEAVVDPRAFTLAGRRSKTVRKAVGRVERHGWTVELLSGAALGPATAAELVAVESAWRRTHQRLYGFAWAGDRLWGAPEDHDDVYAVARDPDGELRAFQRYVRYRRGYSLDAMRRLDDEPNGISDALVAAALEHARHEGCEEVSLNFAGFAHLMAADTLERRAHRLARWGLRPLHGRFQLERLARFAEKFGPDWRPRHLVYSAHTRLPLAAMRVLQAEAYFRPHPRRCASDAWLPAPLPHRSGAPRPHPSGDLALPGG
jgi:lysyl-tRNA synthetase, class II